MEFRHAKNAGPNKADLELIFFSTAKCVRIGIATENRPLMHQWAAAMACHYRDEVVQSEANNARTVHRSEATHKSQMRLQRDDPCLHT